MSRSQMYLKMPKKRKKHHIEYEEKKCKRCHENIAVKRYCDKCMETITNEIKGVGDVG